MPKLRAAARTVAVIDRNAGGGIKGVMLRQPCGAFAFGHSSGSMETAPPPKPPGSRRVGLRIRVQAEHAKAAAARFEEAGFQAIHREHRSDGAVSFWFSKQDAGRMQAIVIAIPVDFYALRAVVGTVR